MTLIDFILNVAGLLLALNLRSVRFDPFARALPTTLAGTLRRTEPQNLRRWHWLAALVILLGLRGVFYWQVGPAVNWTPKLDLAFVVLAFPLRDDASHFGSAELFSLLSCLQTLLVFHFWLLTLLVINRGRSESDPLHRMIVVQLGRLARFPTGALLLMPVAVVAVLWLSCHPLLVQAGIVNRFKAVSHLLGQSALAGMGIYSSLKYLLPAILFVHVITSYIYLGQNPLWDFIGSTARNLLTPLKGFPLRFGKVDLAPVMGIVLILLVLHTVPNLLLSQLRARNLTLWPQ